MTGLKLGIRVNKGQASHDLIMLDAMRGVAALFVVLHHAQFFYGTIGIFSHAYIAVDFFFVLSGFILSIRYKSDFDADMTPNIFLRKRVSRLVPVIMVGIMFGAAVSLADGAPFFRVALQAAAQCVFIPVFALHFPVYPLNAVQWSLLVELFANWLHVALLLQRRSVTLTLLAVGLVALFAIAYRHGSLGVGDMKETWLAGFGRVIFPYGIGVLAGSLWLQAPRRRSTLAGVLSLVSLIVVLLVGSLPVGKFWVFDPLMAALVFPAIVWLGSHGTLSRKFLPLAARLGLISYPLYAFHIPLIRLGELLASGASAQGSTIIRSAAIIFAVLLAAAWAPATGPILHALRRLQWSRGSARAFVALTRDVSILSSRQPSSWTVRAAEPPVSDCRQSGLDP